MSHILQRLARQEDDINSTIKSNAFDGIGLPALENKLQSDLECLCIPPTNWVPQTELCDTDVVIVGGGMCGLLLWFALRTAGIQNVRIIDQCSDGEEGPWVNYARMETLRSPKHLTGPAFGFSSLTFQAWYRAGFGAEKWHELDKIPRTLWMDYLRWYRKALNIPVENNVTLAKVKPSGNLLQLTLEDGNTHSVAARTVVARKLIYATGRDGIAKPNIPDYMVGLNASRWAHSSDNIDFSQLKHQRVAVIGVGASAVDNSAEALEAGAIEVRHLIRRPQMPTINKMMGIGSYGFSAGYANLSDEWRWRFMQYSFATQTPAPRGSTLRVSRHDNAYFHFSKTIHRVCESSTAASLNELTIEFTDGTNLETDFILLGTGFSTDPMARRELGDAAAEIRLWEDVYTPPDDAKNEDLGRFPYLSADFTFKEKQTGKAAWLSNVYCFNYGATASLGKVSGDIPGISEGARWLAQALSSTLYREDVETHWQAIQDYAKPELQGDEWEPSDLPDSSAKREAI